MENANQGGITPPPRRIGGACMVVATAMCIALVGCRGGASVRIDTSVPRPLVEIMPVRVGVYYDDVIATYVHHEDLDGYGRFEIDVGASQIPVFERVFDAMFLSVIPVADHIAHIVPPPPPPKAATDKKDADKKARKKQAQRKKKNKRNKKAGGAEDENEEAGNEAEQEEEEEEVAAPEPPSIDAAEAMAELRRQSIDVDALLVPQIREFQFSLPAQTRTDIYEVWIRYRILLYAPDGSEITRWDVYGYGKADRQNYIALGTQRSDALTDATVWALRDAAAFISFYFPQASGVEEWLAATPPRS